MRLPMILLLGALSSPAYAWYINSGNPLQTRPTPSSVQVSGRIRGFKLTSPAGRVVVVTLPRPARLDEVLPLPAGVWAEITLLLDGPVTVQREGDPPVMLPIDDMTLVLDDPEARHIQLEWRLPEGPLAPAALGLALEEGGLAAPR